MARVSGLDKELKWLLRRTVADLKKNNKSLPVIFYHLIVPTVLKRKAKKYFGFEFCKDGFFDCNYQIRLEKLLYLLYLLTYWYASATFPVHVFLFSNFFSLCDTAGSFAAVQISAARSVYFFVFLIF